MSDNGSYMVIRLLELPLFQGISQTDLSIILGHTKLEFARRRAGMTIVEDNQRCDALLFLLKGKMSVITYSDDRSYHVEEICSAPAVIQPERLFGLSQHYTQTCLAIDRCDLLIIHKAEILKLSKHYEIFRLNLLNAITTQAQRLSRIAWRPCPHSIHDKICRFLGDHCRYPAGTKTFHIKMQTLATAIGESRLNVSQELHDMESEGLLKLSREQIHVDNMEKLWGN